MEPIEASSCCTPTDTAADAARVMRDSGCGCAPVVDDKKNLKLVGVVTERDVCCGVTADDRRASDDPVDEARRKLHEHRATSLPVVDKAGGCCGTVSIHDL